MKMMNRPMEFQRIMNRLMLQQLGEKQSDYIGHFEWKGMHLICDRFRLQLITKEKRGMVIQGVFANIPSKTQEQKPPPQGEQQ